MIGYIKLLNDFPQDLAEKAAELCSEEVGEITGKD